MRNMPLHTWLRQKCFRQPNASIIWKGFLNTIHWIGKGLMWQVGNGKEVLVGADPIVGMDRAFILSVELRSYLEDYGITTLDQAINHATGCWFTAEELDLCDIWSRQWNIYIRDLNYNRIHLRGETDSLLWSFEKYVGPITAAHSYDSLIYIHADEEQNWALNMMWSSKLPLKLICFT